MKLLCKFDSKDPAKVRLVIEDTGIGIPKDRLLAIFKQCGQGDNSTTREFGGTGLGLAISRRLALLMGGEILVETPEVELIEKVVTQLDKAFSKCVA